ncbi:SRPBCC domain-containing protein [Phototrophicus methaneseepsis]|uniref:SRPBCC domain-containing protein n=1 Tax=Phototrophicus methaneseepsis TaxID=2710758 RepID=A0A7S8IFT0_9CHLR|nr:SRPBCC domain-containing protein [Phototrophicus methaneseepsis]QPC83922.1 SRPBCC domain-containing protein [Phototrophicus methaneseepsis]
MPENPVGKTKSQGWEVGVSRTLPIPENKAWQMILSALALPPEDGPESIDYRPGTSFETDDGTQGEIRSYEPGRLIRMKWQPKGSNTNTTLQIRITPAKTGTRISVHHEWLADSQHREAMRAQWARILEDLKDSIT